MKTLLQISSRSVSRSASILVSYLLLAACMQEEHLAPRQQGIGGSALDVVDLNAGAKNKGTFTAHLNSGNEVPTNGLPVISKGQGQAIFKLSDDGTTLHYKLIVANIANVTQAHIHCGAEGVNGAVVVFLFGFNAAGVTVNGVLAEGTITSANIIARPDGPTCAGGLQTFTDLIGRLRTGTAYVNVHTLAYPAGEIRGQVK